jgi:hypothetical protein
VKKPSDSSSGCRIKSDGIANRILVVIIMRAVGRHVPMTMDLRHLHGTHSREMMVYLLKTFGRVVLHRQA